MMAAASKLGMAPIRPDLCGRGHRVAKALGHEIADPAQQPSPLHAALQNIAPTLRGSSTVQKLTELAMLLDQNPACRRSDMHAASSI